MIVTKLVLLWIVMLCIGMIVYLDVNKEKMFINWVRWIEVLYVIMLSLIVLLCII